MTSGQIVGKMDAQKQLNVPLEPLGARLVATSLRGRGAFVPGAAAAAARARLLAEQEGEQRSGGEK